uniref:Uncharacterized protein n=1 Tax=Populus davidiana TaxID=266767 RepID=A0A6M2E742_9ROSI
MEDLDGLICRLNEHMQINHYQLHPTSESTSLLYDCKWQAPVLYPAIQKFHHLHTPQSSNLPTNHSSTSPMSCNQSNSATILLVLLCRFLDTGRKGKERTARKVQDMSKGKK